MYVVGSVASEDFGHRCFEPSERVRPHICRGAHEALVCLVVEALKNLKPDATAEDLRAYLSNLKGFAGINGTYDFTAVPNRGLSESNVIVTRWDAVKKTWIAVSGPLGVPRGL